MHPSMVERASSIDLMELASDVGPAPLQVGAVLRFGAGRKLTHEEVSEAIEARTGGVRRLRQQLMPTPVGCGRPIWVDDADFKVSHHVRAVSCPAPGDEVSLLALTAELLTTPLPSDSPLWSATLVNDLADSSCALVVLFHHVLTDGMGGLAVLANLVDGAPAVPARPSATTVPGRWDLARDAAASRLRTFGHARRAPAVLRAAWEELAPGSVPKAARCSLNRPVGRRRRFVTVTAPLEKVRTVAHAHGASVNDVVLAAVGSALDAQLAAHGEHVDAFVISVPVSGRSQESASDLGNQVGVMPVAVPATGPRSERVEVIAQMTGARKSSSRGASAILLAPGFRILATIGILKRCVDHQHLVHTFTTNLRGPEDPISFLGRRVRQVIPLSALSGNVAVAFAVMSYADELAVTVVIDPDVIPEPTALTEMLAAELNCVE